MSDGLVDYYRRRADHYDEIYAKPERQADLAALAAHLRERLAGRRVLEVACGTGYWTERITAAAAAVVAVDAAPEPLAIARARPYAKVPTFELADAFDLSAVPGSFEAALAGHWWSHVPMRRQAEFLASLHARLAPRSRVLFFDNVYVEGSSTPISDTDEDGNTYQQRRLPDASTARVLKNFPSPEGLRATLAPHARRFSYRAWPYYWLVEYERP